MGAPPMRTLPYSVDAVNVSPSAAGCLLSAVSRRANLETLIRFLPEALNGGGGGMDWISGGPDSKLLTFGPLFHADCVKDRFGGCVECCSPFPALLDALANLDPITRRHVWARFHGGYWAMRRVRFSRHGFPFLEEGCEVVSGWGGPGRSASSKPFWHQVTVHVWPDWVDNAKVESGLRGLDSSMPDGFLLPRELAA